MTELAPFDPENPLEEAILEAHEGRSTRDEMLKWLCHSTVLVASIQPVEEGDITGFKPLLMGNEQMPLVSIFTAPSRQALYGDVARHMLVMLGGDYFVGLPKDYGVVINPGSVVQFALTPIDMAEIRAKLDYKQL